MNPNTSHLAGIKRLLLGLLKLAIMVGAVGYFLSAIVSTYAYVMYVEESSASEDFADGAFEFTGLNAFNDNVQLVPVGLSGEWLEQNASLPDSLTELAAAIGGDKIFAIGGYGTDYSAKVYSATINTSLISTTYALDTLYPWVDVGTDLPAAVGGAAAVMYQASETTSYLYVLGGVTGTSCPATSTVYYATVNNTTGALSAFNTTTSLPKALYYHSALIYGDTIYVMGGLNNTGACAGGTGDTSGSVYYNTIQSNGTLGGSWTEAPSLPPAKGLMSGAAVVYSRTIFYIGGVSYNSAGTGIYTTTEKVYFTDIQNDMSLTNWQASTNGFLPYPLQSHAAVETNGQILVVGGNQGTFASPVPTDTVLAAIIDLDDPDDRIYDWCPGSTCIRWETVQGQSLPQALAAPAAVEQDGEIWILGGDAGTGAVGQPVNTVYHGTIHGKDAIHYAFEGRYTSNIINLSDPEQESIQLKKLVWQAIISPTGKMSVSMQYRAGDSPVNVLNASWTDAGLLNETNAYTHTINGGATDSFYFQYQVSLTTTREYSDTSPGLDRVKIYYDVPNPDVQVSKSSPQEQAGGAWSGAFITYTIRYTAAGGVPAEGVVITETVPDNTNTETFWNTDWGPVGDVYTYDVGTFGLTGVQSSTDVISFTVQLTSERKPEISYITNEVCIDFPPMFDALNNVVTDPITSNNCFTLPILCWQVFWDISKEATPTQGTEVVPGDVITYEVWYTNTGTTTESAAVVITDTVDALLTGITPMDGGVVNGNVVTWTKTTVAPDPMYYSVRFTATVKRPVDFASQELENTAEIQSVHGGLTTSLPITHLVVATPTFHIVKVADPTQGDTVEPGDAITYTISYSNTGTRNANTAVISDVVDLALLESINPLDGGVLTDDTINWTVNVTANSQTYSRSFTATVKSQTVPRVDLVNTATILFEQFVSDSVPISHSIFSMSVLGISKSAWAKRGPYVLAGEPISYFLTYSNTGTVTAVQVIITDVVDIALLEGINPLDGGVLLPDGKTITWTVGNVQANTPPSTVSFSGTVKAAASVGSEIINAARIESLYTVLKWSNEVSHTVSELPALWITKTDGITLVAPDQYVTYTIVYTRQANSLPAENVIITETIPANTSVAPWDAANWTLVSSQVYRRSMGKMNDTQVTTTIALQVDDCAPAGLTLPNQVQIDATEVGAGSVKTATDVNTVKEAVGLKVSKSDGLSQIGTGQSVNYTIRYTNTGNKVATVVLTDTPSTYLTYTGGGWTPAGGGKYTKTVSLNPCQSSSVNFQATMALNPPGSVGSVINQVQIDSPDKTEPTGQETAQDTDTIVGPSLWVTKTTPASVFDPDDFITYTIQYGNSSNKATASGVVITEVIDTNVVEYVATGNWVPVNASTYSLTIGTLTPGQSGSVPFRVKVKSVEDVELSTPFTNTLYIDGTNVRVAPESPVFKRNYVRGPDLTFTPMEIELSHNAPTTNDMVTIKVTVTTAADSTPLENVSPSPLYSATVDSTFIYGVAVELYVTGTASYTPTGPSDHLGGLCKDEVCAVGRYTDYFHGFADADFNSTTGETRVLEFHHQFEKQATYDVYVQVDIYLEGGYIGHSPDYGDYKEMNEDDNIVSKKGIKVILGDTYLPIVFK